MKKNILLFSLLISIQFAYAQAELPDDFYEIEVSNGWDIPVGFTFDETGKMYVWEKPGRVHIVDTNGVRLSEPLLDIREEVSPFGDMGLLGFALDPNFSENGYFYTAYAVDGHYLRHFGTPEYHPDTSRLEASIGRVTRFTADAATNFETLVPDSRKVLIGESITTGVPLMQKIHSPGALVFGTDGTLLVASGDGTSLQNFEEQGLADGIITAKEDVNSFRAQLIDSHNGKILRINPETGDGVPSNPFYDTGNPRAPRSRVWALGLRNPYRIALRPGTGSHFEADANPGILYVSDVGSGSWEELNVVTEGGQNFGWPMYEGMTLQITYFFNKTPNMDAPNPLFDGNSCTKEFFDFQDLLLQATLNEPIFENPCDENQSIPDNNNLFLHRRPSICHNNDNWYQPTRTFTPGYDSLGNAIEISVLDNASPIESDTFTGFAIIAGEFYEGNSFPEAYQKSLYVFDYSGWIKRFNYNENHELLSVEPFAEDIRFITHMGVHPQDGCLYFFKYQNTKMFKICYGGNPPPVAIADANVYYGASPLTVNFDASASFDPNGFPITYQWNFGDNSPLSEIVNPTHQFIAPNSNPYTFNVELTVTDSLGESATDAFIISLNNTPPQVEITSFEDGTVYPISGPTLLPLSADVTDNEHLDSELTYEWQTILHHNTHFHADLFDNNKQTSTLISPLGCDDGNYYYRIKLRVTDAAGLASEDEKYLYPNCVAPTFELDDIAAVADDEKITLSWSTLMENGTDYFGVNRSIGDFNFAEIGTTAANGIATDNYQFTDNNPINGVNAYRLEVYDSSENYEYSKIVYVDFPALPSLYLYPNPANDLVTLRFTEINNTAFFRLYNYLGQGVYKTTWRTNGEAQFTLSVADLPPGVYIYMMDDGNTLKSGKLVIE